MMTMTRRQWLSGSGLALATPRLAAAADSRPSRVRLSLNENPFGPSPAAVQAIRQHLDGLCRYVGSEAAELTDAAAARERMPGEQIVLGEILDALGLYLALDGGPGGEFIYSVPGYTELVDAVAPGGGRVVGVPLNQNLENDLPAIAAALNEHTRAVYLVNPHNPTGTVSDAARFLEFLRQVSKRALVIVDEAYLEFDPDFAARTAVPLVRSGEQIAVFRTFGKLYGLAGLSMGYLIAPKALAASLRRHGVGSALTLNRLALVAATASLADKDYVARVRAKVAVERTRWHELLQLLNRRYSASHGNFVFFETGRPHDEVASVLVAKGVEIGRAFPPMDGWVRISIGLPDDNAAARSAVAELLR